MAFTKRWQAALVIFGAVIIAEVLIFTSNLARATRAVIFRAHFIIIIQTVLLFLTRFVWRRLSTFFDSHVDVKVKADTTTTTRETEFGTSGQRASVLISLKRRFKTQPSAFLWRTIVLLYLCCCHLSYLTNVFFINTEPAVVSMFTYVCLGTLIHLITGMVIMGIISYLYHLFRTNKYSSSNVIGPRFRKRTIGALIYALSISLYGLYTAHKLPTVKTVQIPIKDLPASMEGLRIVQLSDIHLGPTVGRAKMSAIVTLTNQLRPDVIVLTGDLVDGSVNRLRRAAEPLQKLQTNYGKFYITGNHEYYTGDVENWMVYMRMLGFTVLDNAHTKLIPREQTDAEICIAGTNDLEAERFGYLDHALNFNKALGSCDPKFPTILLTHQPKAAKLALQSKHRVDLVLSGHTHGGQMFPIIIGAYFANPFYAGLYKYGSSSHVYVSMGTVYWGIPMRVFTTREISEIILTRWEESRM